MIEKRANTQLKEIEQRDFRSDDQIVEKFAKAYLRQRFKLSETGQALKAKVEAALDSGEFDNVRHELPTVENPRLELFGELNLGSADAEDIFGPDLANIQVTKGCTHGCGHCAARSGKLNRDNIMPFAGILKIAEANSEYNQIFEDYFRDRKIWQEIILNRILGKSQEDDWDEEEWAKEIRCLRMSKPELYKELHDFDLFLRQVLKKSGLQLRLKEYAGSALR